MQGMASHGKCESSTFRLCYIRLYKHGCQHVNVEQDFETLHRRRAHRMFWKLLITHHDFVMKPGELAGADAKHDAMT